MKRRNYEYVKEFISDLGYMLIDDKYIKSHDKLTLEDSEGYSFYISFHDLQHGQKPSRFHRYNPYTIKNIQLWCVLNNKPFKLIDGQQYKNNYIKLQWQCFKLQCGEIFESSWDSILANHGCGICTGMQVGLSNCLITKNPELALEWHPTKNGKITPYDVTPYSKKSVWWQCSKNLKHEWKATISNRHSGNGCPYCSHYLLSEEYNLLKLNSDLCKEWDYEKNKKRPEEYFPNSKEKVWWKCKECGHEWKREILKRNNGIGCPECNESKGEKRIREWLKLHYFQYIPQKQFDDLLGLSYGNLSYDFYLPKLNLLIEYQGEQHERFVKGIHKSKKDFEKQQEHDRRKKEYAINNNINLLEIWYFDFDNIEDILSNILKSS